MMLNADLDPAEGKLAPEQLLGRLIDRHSAMDYQAAAELALQLVDAAPDRSLAHYNLACVMARLNRPEAAIAALDRAVDCGWRSVTHMTLDPDLQSLREMEGFARVITKMQAKVAEEKIAEVPLRSDELDAIVKDLDANVPALLARYRVPGASVALVRDGKVMWMSAYGVNGAADSQSAAALADDTMFRVRAPMQVLALIAGAQQQQRGAMQLADVLKQAADLDRMDTLVQRDRAKSGGRQQTGDRDQNEPVATPVSANASRGATNSSNRTNPRLYGRSGSAVYGFLRVTVEMTSGQDFGAYCDQNIFQPAAMVSSRFVPPGQSDLNRLAIGHTPLGTAVAQHCPGEDRAIGGCMYTTAQDMGRLIESMMSSNSAESNAAQDAAANVDPVAAMGKIAASIPGGLSMNVSIEMVKDAGRRIQVVDRTDGQGCLLQWYPSNRSGIAVMFNSATGVEAAERIAHIALGGK
jgi:CubicO group peptidase (beta-lactamase class C family)